MKSIGIKLAAVSLLVAGLAFGAQKQDSGERQLKAARTIELVDGNLKAAIEQYRKVASATDRVLAAKALVYMAEAYQKLGDAESQKIYEQIVRQYSDQKDAVAVARARLTKSAPHTGGDRPVWSGPDVDGFGTISPDGRFLTYVDWARTGALMLRDLFNGTDRQLTSESRLTGSRATGAEYSAISKDGKQVAYQWHAPNQASDLRLMSIADAGAAEPRILVHNGEFDISPSDWSPDGKWIAVRMIRRDRTVQIGLVWVPQGSLRVLKTNGWNDREGKISFSPDGRYIAYAVSNDERAADIFVMAIDGSRETAAVTHPSRNEVMGWSPDGKYLLFASNRTGSFGLWTLPISDGKPQGTPMLVRSDIGSSWSLGVSDSGALYTWKTTGAPYVQVSAIDLVAGKLAGPPTGFSQRFIESRGRPSWSVDGKQLAFSSCGLLGGGACSLLVQSLETGRVREVKAGMGYFAFVAWSPNGKEVLLSGTDLNARQGIFRINVETGETSVVVENPLNRRWAQWSPDGKSIYYQLGDATNLVIAERSIASGEEREILRAPAENVANFSFSPDRTFVVALSASGAKSQILILPVNGAPVRHLFPTAAPQSIGTQGYFSWTPDGRAVLVVRSSTDGNPAELWEIPVDGSAPRKLSIDMSTWTLEGVTLNPDGKHVAFVASAAKSGLEIWALENFLPKVQAKN